MKLHVPCFPVEVVGPDGTGLGLLWGQRLAGVAIRLGEAEGAGPRISGVGKDVAHIVEEHQAEGVAEVRQRGRRQAQLGAVDQRPGSADRDSPFRRRAARRR